MEYALCNLTMIPLRAGPTHKAEMVSQLLFGELLAIEAREEGWLQVVCDYDGYRGWIDPRQCRPVSEAFVEQFHSAPSPVSHELLQIVFNETKRIAIPVCLGSTLPKLDGNRFTVDDDQYTYDGQSLRCSNATRGSICDTALLYLNAPYLWGGRSPFGIDCSGLVQMVFRINGFRMKRDASMQAGQGSQVSFADSAEPGDIAFFENEEGNISHTGIVLHGKKIIHASGRVRIDDLDHEGIFNQELKKYTHKLRLIKTLL